MTLDEYLRLPGSPNVREFRARLHTLGYEVKSDDQIRQWRHGYYNRVPSPEYCMGIHLATDGKVSLKELRPEDWERIWPEYHGNKSGGSATRKIKESRREAM